MRMVLARGDWYFTVCALIVGAFMSAPYVYAVQQDNYRVAEVWKSRRVRGAYLADLLCILVFGGAWAGCWFLSSRMFWGFLTSLFFCIAEVALYIVDEAPKRKKPLRYTRRAVRAMAAVSLVSGAAVTAAIAFINVHVEDEYLRYPVFFALSALYPLIFSGTLAFVNIFERMNNRRYERRTRRALSAERDLVRIGITGSYGKTTVKNALAAMLSVRFNVLATPASYNTPMGIARAVRELNSSHDFFIAEMGARRRGDIARLMRIVRPSHTILTGINDQHLETFGSREGIVREKLKILDVRAEDGACIVNDRLAALPAVAENRRDNIVLAGGDEHSRVHYSDVTVCADGSAFTLWFYGTPVQCVTRLLGVHNVEDITLAAAMAFRFGISPEEIRDAVAELAPVPHRLQLIEGNGISIIDDTFNTNPDGAKRALEVLALFPGRKVALTPGMVELGAEENAANKELGRMLASVADVVLLVGGRRARTVAAGLKEGGFEGETRVYATLADAQADFKRVLHVGDVLLLLNDLPDCYDD